VVVEVEVAAAAAAAARAREGGAACARRLRAMDFVAELRRYCYEMMFNFYTHDLRGCIARYKEVDWQVLRKRFSFHSLTRVIQQLRFKIKFYLMILYFQCLLFTTDRSKVTSCRL
jgi:hypothetical protein